MWKDLDSKQRVEHLSAVLEKILAVVEIPHKWDKQVSLPSQDALIVGGSQQVAKVRMSTL